MDNGEINGFDNNDTEINGEPATTESTLTPHTETATLGTHTA